MQGGCDQLKACICACLNFPHFLNLLCQFAYCVRTPLQHKQWRVNLWVNHQCQAETPHSHIRPNQHHDQPVCKPHQRCQMSIFMGLGRRFIILHFGVPLCFLKRFVGIWRISYIEQWHHVKYTDADSDPQHLSVVFIGQHLSSGCHPGQEPWNSK